MAFFSHVVAGTRTIRQKGDIRDVIERLDVRFHPVYKFLPKTPAQDIYVEGVEDVLASPDRNNAYPEGAAAPAAVDTARSLNGNYCQLLLKTAHVSDTQKAVAQYGLDNELAYQEAKKTVETMRDIELFCISNGIAQAPTLANLRIGRMAGVSTIIVSHIRPCSSFNQASWNALMEATLRDGGWPTTGWMDAIRKRAFSGWVTNIQRVSDQMRSLESEVNAYHGPLGPTVTVDWHPMMPADVTGNGGAACCFVLQPDLWEVKELLTLNRQPIGNAGSAKATMIEWQGAIRCNAEKGNYQFIDALTTTTSAAQ